MSETFDDRCEFLYRGSFVDLFIFQWPFEGVISFVSDEMSNLILGLSQFNLFCFRDNVLFAPSREQANDKFSDDGIS